MLGYFTMKKIYLLLLLNIFGCLGQKNNVAYYNIKYVDEIYDSNSTNTYSPYLSAAKTYEDDVFFRLIFNTTNAVFEIIDDNKNSENRLAFNLSGYKKPVFTDLKNKTLNSLNEGNIPFQIEDEKYLLVDSLINLKWQFHNESKMINEIEVFKASLAYTTVDNKHFKVTAWYAPSLPYAYGPLLYGGLPGLIVQLQDKGKLYTLSKIEFESDLKVPKTPEKELIMTSNQFQKMFYDIYLEKTKNL